MINKIQNVLQEMVDKIHAGMESGTDTFMVGEMNKTLFARVAFCEQLGLEVVIKNWEVTVTEK